MNKVKLLCCVGLMVLATATLSCSKGTTDPSAPPVDDKQQLTGTYLSDNSTRQLWGFWLLNVDPTSGQVEVIPAREAAGHWNVLKWLEKGPCTSCLKVVDIADSDHGTKLMTISIKHPFPSLNLTGFDVRGIAMFNGSHDFPAAGLTAPESGLNDGELINADGYTSLYNVSTEGLGPGGLQGYLKGKFATPTAPDALLNGFIRFDSGDPANTRNAFYGGDTIVKVFDIEMPGVPFVMGYAVDASWAPPTVKPVTDSMTDFPPEANCYEPYSLSVTVADGSLTDVGGTLTLNILIEDHQGASSFAAPVIECPDLFDGTLTATPGGPDGFHVTINNDKLAPAGLYKALLSVEDNENAGSPSWVDLTSYQIFNIEVIENPGWARTFGSTEEDTCWKTVVDQSGNVYLTGYFAGMDVDFDPGPGVAMHSSNGEIDIYLSKFDPSGNLVWTLTWGGPTIDGGVDIGVDDAGNVYFTGTFSGSAIDFDPNSGVDFHSSVGSVDIFLSKFNSSGEFQWARTWGGDEWDYSMAIEVDGSGNVIVTGAYLMTVDFDPGPGENIQSSNGAEDTFLSKFDSSGNLQWALTWGGTYTWDNGYGVGLDDSGNVYAAGSFGSSFDFDPGPGVETHSTNGLGDAFLSKFDSSGNFQWARTWGGATYDSSTEVQVNVDGDAYTCGYYSEADVDFDPTSGVDFHTSNGSYDFFLNKFNSSGDFMFARTWGGVDYDKPNGIAVYGPGDVYVCGSFAGADIDFDPASGVDAHSSNGSADACLSKFDSSGNFVWARTWGGTLGEYGSATTVDGTGNVFVVGAYNSPSVDFDPGPGVDDHISYGNGDVFLVKFKPGGYW